jgi:hypothetical protein
MSTIATPPAEVPAVPVATEPVTPTTPTTTETPVESTEEVKPDEAPVEGAEAPAEGATEPATEEVAEEDDPFFSESTLPAEQVTKLKQAFGDDALKVVAQLEQVQTLEQTFGEIPSIEFIQSLASGQEAIGQLYEALDKDPQQAVDYFLLDEKGGLDAKGAQFVGALADGVRRGTIPMEARMRLAQASFASALTDINNERAELEREIAYAEKAGKEAKVQELQIQLGEQAIIGDYLKKFLGIKLPTRVPAAKDPERLKLEEERAAFEKQKAEAAAERLGRLESQQVAAYQSIVDQEVAKFTSLIPATVPATLKEAAIQGAKAKLATAAMANERQKFFQKHHENALEAAARGNGSQEAFNKARNAYRNMMQVVASQVYGPILKELGVVVEAKGKAVVDARKAGEQKLGAPPVAATAGEPVPSNDWKWDPSKETREQYTNRMMAIATGR